MGKDELNEQFGILREKKKGIQERLGALNEERQAKTGDSGPIIEARNKNSEKIKELIAQRTTLREEFNAEKAKFREYIAEQKRIRQEKWAEEKAAQQEQWRIAQLEKKVAALDEQPFVAEITLIEQTLKFCNDLLPKEEGAAKEEKKETTYNKKDKKGPAAKADGAPKSKPIKHNAETFKLFEKLKLDAPITTADIPALIEKLGAQKADFEKKVEEWKENKEEMKRKIKEGIIKAEDLDDNGQEKKAE